jgi:phenylpropionate dioxygenase-like ring-hydroxylating dioxygenase large terminal subunit
MVGTDALVPLPVYPESWHYFCAARELQPGPLARDLLGRRLVGFRAENGQRGILDARCSHQGTDLGAGVVKGDCLQCPLHNWEYRLDGSCARIPAQEVVPPFARQSAYPVVERHGFVYFFNRSEPLFPLPFFADTSPGDFLPARPFEFVLNCPWYMIGAHAFDVQHFRATHDRELLQEPVIDCPAPLARRIILRLRVAGDSWADRITRRLAGDTLEMRITVWAGNIVFTTAVFPRTRSHGMVMAEPLSGDRTHAKVFVFVPRSGSRLGRFHDLLHAEIRRWFIKQFLQNETPLLHGLRYTPRSFIAADRPLADYFPWLAGLSHATSERHGIPESTAMANVPTNGRTTS